MPWCRICLRIASLLSWFCIVADGIRRDKSAGATNGVDDGIRRDKSGGATNGTECKGVKLTCTQKVTQHTCMTLGVQRKHFARRLASTLRAEEADVADLLGELGADTDDFSCEHLCKVAVAHIPIIFGFSVSLYAELACLSSRSDPTRNMSMSSQAEEPDGLAIPMNETKWMSMSARARLALRRGHVGEIIEDDLQEKPSEKVSKKLSRQILLDRLLRAMFGFVSDLDADADADAEHEDQFALMQHSEEQETTWGRRRPPPQQRGRPQTPGFHGFLRQSPPITSNSTRYLSKYKAYSKRAVDRISHALKQVKANRAQGALRRWFHAKRSDMRQVSGHVEAVLGGMLKVFRNLYISDGDNMCDSTTLAHVPVRPGVPCEGVKVCGQQVPNNGRFKMTICPFFWSPFNHETVLTFVHEASHVICTRDHMYCSVPFQCNLFLDTQKARNNADTFAYFVNDVYWTSWR